MNDLECSNTSNGSAISYNLLKFEFESFDEEELTQECDESPQQLICGEIILNNKRSISFNCSFCHIQIRNLEIYLKHIVKNHLVLTKEEAESVLNEIMEKERGCNVVKSENVCYNVNMQQSEDSVDFSDTPTNSNQFQENNEDYLCHFQQFLTDTSAKVDSLTDVKEEEEIIQEKINDTEYEDIELLDDSSEEVSHFKTEVDWDDVKYEIEVLQETTHNDNELKEIKDKNSLNSFKKPNKTTLSQQRKSKLGVILCSQCPKMFRNKAQLNLHTKRHSSDKPFICEYCDARFADSSNLKVHINRHLGIKPHCCALCEKSFISTTELKLHMRSHTGERPYVCQECGRKFSSSGHLKSHRRRHYNERPFECETCGKDFYDRRLLRDHEAAHSSERPFVCDICNTTFKRQKALSEHKKLHSGIRKYKCKICHKAFAQNAGLWSHMKQHYTSSRNT